MRSLVYEDQCPRCGDFLVGGTSASYALSRQDNKTRVCSDCGAAEGMIAAGMTPFSLEVDRAFWFAGDVLDDN